MLCKPIYYQNRYVFVKTTFIAKFRQKLCKFQIDVGPWELPLHIKFENHYSTRRSSWLNTRTRDAQWSLFSSKSQTFGFGQTIWADNFGEFGIFLNDLSAPILVLWVSSLSCLRFPLINHYFCKKLRIYILLNPKSSDWDLNLGLKELKISHRMSISPWLDT